MKKYILLLSAAVAALAVASCNGKEDMGGDYGKKSLTIHATVSAEGFSFAAGDAITVLCDGESYNFTTVQGGASADFVTTDGLTQEKVGINPITAYYGCNEVGTFTIAPSQTVSGGVSQTKLPLYAYTAQAPEKAELSLSFKPAASLLNVTLSPAEITLNKVELVPVEETSVVGNMAGQATVNPLTGKVTQSGSIKKVEASFPGGASLAGGLSFSLPVGWFSVSGGAKLVLSYNNGSGNYEELLWDKEPFQSYETSGDKKSFKAIPVQVELVLGARDYYVAANGSASSKGISESDPTTLDVALASADEGSVLHLAAGTYKPERVLKGTLTADDAHKTFEIARGLTLIGADAATTILDGNGSFHAVCVTSLPEGKVVLKNLTIKGADASAAEKADEDAGTGYVQSSVNQKNYNDNYGAGLYAIGSDIEMENVIITGNIGKNAAGGFIGDGAKASLKNIEVKSNTSALGNGVGLWIDASTATVEDCNFSKNEGAGTAVGLYIYAATGKTCSATVTNCTISENSTSGNYAGVYVRGGDAKAKVSATFTNCTISKNQAGVGGTTGMGGGFGVIYATASFEGCQILENGATGNGANIVYPGSKATVKDCIFRGNSATGLCAAIYLCDSNANAGETPELTVLNSEFSGNTTNGRGGAIGARATASVGVKLIVANSTFFGNTCKSTGSAIALWGAADKPVTADIYSCTITGNTTTRATTTAGGAIGQETKGVTVNIYNSILSGNSWSANAPAANLYTVDATTAKAYKSINASAVYGADGAVDSGAPAFAPLAMLSKKTQEGKSTVFQLVGDNNPAQTYGYDAASLKALNASLQDVLGKDQWGNTRSASKMGAYVE